MTMEKRYLDCVLVPMGILLMVAYHLWLLHRIVKHPTKTVIGVNTINRHFWVRAMMEDVGKNGVLAVQSLRNNIMASTVLASTVIMLSSLIAILMTTADGERTSWFVFGDRSDFAYSIKFFLILACFLLAFLFDLQSIRCYSHASILINVPVKRMSQLQRHHHLTIEYVANMVNKEAIFGPWGYVRSTYLFLCFCGSLGPFRCSYVALPLFSCFISSTLPFNLGGLLGLLITIVAVATRMRNWGNLFDPKFAVNLNRNL